MSRRKFIRLLVGLFVAAPRIAIAQGSTAVRRIGFLDGDILGTPDEISASLRKLGWVEGQNLHIERRYSNSLDELQPLAEELVRAKVEVIVAGGPNQTLAAMRATTTIPIVFRAANDPIRAGLVASLARPGGNVTGFSASLPEVTAKVMSLLKELLPGIQRIAALETSGNAQFRLFRGQFEDACRSAGIEPVPVEVGAAGEIDGAIARLASQRVQALFLRADKFIITHQVEIVSAALRYGLPSMATDADFVDVGALASYGYTQAEGDRRGASFVDRILRGAKAADLPVEQPTQFELAINLRTARALGLTIPQSLLLRADKVIR